MASSIRHLAAVLAALVVGACSLVEQGLWPTLTGEEPAGAPAERVAIVPSPVEGAGATIYGREAGFAAGEIAGAPRVVPLETAPTAAAAATGTFVGGKVQSVHAELDGLRQALAAHNQDFQQILNSTTDKSQRYHALIAAINARLQVGTTPGNPVLAAQWEAAQVELDNVIAETSRLKELSNRIAGHSAMANYLVESVRAAYGLQGAVDEDHRQLAIVEDEVDRTVVSIERLLTEVNESALRQESYAAGERRNLTGLALAISHGEAFGPSLASFAFAPARLARAAAGTAETAAVDGGALGARPPLVVIRFDRPDVAYEHALYDAVGKALERRPAAVFDLLAVTPGRGSPSEVAARAGEAKDRAEQVLRSLLTMGLAPDRVNLSSTTSPTALTNEVHVYVR